MANDDDTIEKTVDVAYAFEQFEDTVFDDDRFQDYMSTTLSPAYDGTFRLATVILMGALILLFVPTLRLVRCLRKRRKMGKQADRNNDTTEVSFEPPTLLQDVEGHTTSSKAKRNGEDQSTSDETSVMHDEDWSGMDIYKQDEVFGSDDYVANAKEVEPPNYMDLKWIELPQDIKETAKVIGCTQATWDKHIFPGELRDTDWKDLPESKQVAAMKLGYHKLGWNGNGQEVVWHGAIQESISSNNLDDRPEDGELQPQLIATLTAWSDDGQELVWQESTSSSTSLHHSKSGYKRIMVKVGDFWRKPKSGAILSLSEADAKSQITRKSSQKIGRYLSKKWRKNRNRCTEEPLLENNHSERKKNSVRAFVNGKRSMTDLLDGVDFDDDLFAVVSHVNEDGTKNDNVPLFKTSMGQVSRFGPGGGNNVLLGRNNRSLLDNPTGDVGTPRFLRELLVDDEDDIHMVTFMDADPDEMLEETEGDMMLPNYDNCDWDELPSDARIAAEILGYTENMWDMDEEPERVKENDWEDLNMTQQAAALELGWNQPKWDGVASDGSSKENAVRHVKTEVSKGWQMVHNVLTYDKPTKRILKLAIPATIADCLNPLLEGIKTTVLITHMGPSKYLAWVMVEFFLEISHTLVEGVAEAEGLLTAQAIGMKKYFLVGQYVQITLVLEALVSVPAYALWVIFIGDIMENLGFGEEVAGYARAYIPFGVIARIIEGSLIGAIERLMWNEERGITMTILEVGYSVCYTGAFLIMILGFGIPSLVTLGLLDVIAAAVYFACIYFVCSVNGWLKKYTHGIFGHWAMKNRALIFGVLKMSAPLTIGHILLNCEWQVLTLFAAYMGPAETAAWSIAGTLWKILEAIPSGVEHGAEILVANYLGRGRPDFAKLVAYKTFVYSVGATCVACGLFICFRDILVFYFTGSEVLYDLVYDLVALICIGSVIVTLGNAAYAILESQGRTKVPVTMYFLAITLITIPLSAWFTFGKNYGLESILMACIAGYCVSSFGMLVVVFTTNWPKMSRKVILKATQYELEMTAMVEKSDCVD